MQHSISLEELKEKNFFWQECLPFFHEFEYNAYGIHTLEIPKFHKKNLQNEHQTFSTLDHQYPSHLGSEQLRIAALSDFPSVVAIHSFKKELSVQNIIVTPGVLPAINYCVDIFASAQDDEIITFEPIYPSHLVRITTRFTSLKLNTVRMDYSKENGFQVNFKQLKQALSPKTKLLILCNPHNPMCKIFTKEEYEAIQELLLPFPNIIVLEDCAYFQYHSPRTPISYFSTINDCQMFDRTLTFFSAGKSFNVTGLRVGIVVGDEKLLEKLALGLFKEGSIASPVEQSVIKADLIDAPKVQESGLNYYDTMNEIIYQNFLRIQTVLDEIGIKCIPWEGTYYALFEIENFRNKIPKEFYTMLDGSKKHIEELDQAFCRMMFVKYKIGLIPLSCTYFGENPPDNLVRVALNRNEKDIEFLIKGLNNLKSI